MIYAVIYVVIIDGISEFWEILFQAGGGSYLSPHHPEHLDHPEHDPDVLDDPEPFSASRLLHVSLVVVIMFCSLTLRPNLIGPVKA